MKAIVWTNYGPPDILQLSEVEKPDPQEDEILVKVRATTVTTGDCEIRSLKLPLWTRLPMRLFVGFRKPKRVTMLGSCLAGEIETMGKIVSGYRNGDQVFGFTGMRFGAYAEYVCLPGRGKWSRKRLR